MVLFIFLKFIFTVSLTLTVMCPGFGFSSPFVKSSLEF